MVYTVFQPHSENDFDIWKGEHYDGDTSGEKHFSKFSDAKKYTIMKIDTHIAFLKGKRKAIKSLKMADVFEPQEPCEPRGQ